MYSNIHPYFIGGKTESERVGDAIMKQFIRSHPYASYFTLTFGWTWIIVFAIILAETDVKQPTPQFIIGGILCNISPSIAAFIKGIVSVCLFLAVAVVLYTRTWNIINNKTSANSDFLKE